MSAESAPEETSSGRELPSRPPIGATLPTERTFDPAPPVLRSIPKEAWEPQKRATRRPDFVERIAKTSDRATEPVKVVERAALGSQRGGAIAWEAGEDREADEVVAAPSPPPPFHLSRGQRWTLAGLAGVVLLLAIAWAAKMLLGSHSTAPPPVSATGGPTGDATAEPLIPGVSDSDYAELTTVVSGFLSAASLDEVMPFVRDPQRVRPLMDVFYQADPWQAYAVRRMPGRDEVQTNRDMLACVAEVGDFQKRILALQRTPGGLKLDWEAFVGHGDLSWESLALRRPTTPCLLRVRLTPDEYYNFAFADSAKFACYRLSSQDGTHHLFGYAARDSATYGALLGRTRMNRFLLPTLKIRYPEGATQPDQVEIVELVADGWLVSESSRVTRDDPPAPVPAAPPK